MFLCEAEYRVSDPDDLRPVDQRPEALHLLEIWTTQVGSAKTMFRSASLTFWLMGNVRHGLRARLAGGQDARLEGKTVGTLFAPDKRPTPTPGGRSVSYRSVPMFDAG